jgi:hypothetical protein
MLTVLIEWFAAFGVAQQWVSDQGSHFKNTVMADIQKQLGTNHHFTTAYSPWANGTVEAVCKQTIRAARAMLSSGTHLAPQEWPCVLPAIQAVLNNSQSSHSAGQKTLTDFTGHARDTPLSLTILHPIANHSLYLSLRLNNSPKVPTHPTSRATSQGSNGQGITITTEADGGPQR